jgi:hypothetical protein
VVVGEAASGPISGEPDHGATGRSVVTRLALALQATASRKVIEREVAVVVGAG